jgi:hypothetical protein
VAALEALARQVEHLIERYFERAGAPLRQALMLNGLRFCNEPSVVQNVEAAKRQFGATGHCCTADPPGVMMINGRRELAFLLVSDDSYATSCAEIADAERNDGGPLKQFAEDSVGGAGPRQAWMNIVAAAEPQPGSSWRTTIHQCCDLRRHHRAAGVGRSGPLTRRSTGRG